MLKLEPYNRSKRSECHPDLPSPLCSILQTSSVRTSHVPPLNICSSLGVRGAQSATHRRQLTAPPIYWEAAMHSLSFLSAAGEPWAPRDDGRRGTTGAAGRWAGFRRIFVPLLHHASDCTGSQALKMFFMTHKCVFFSINVKYPKLNVEANIVTYCVFHRSVTLLHSIHTQTNTH